MGKRRVDDMGVADAVDELVDADTGKQALLSEEAVVGRIVELEQFAECVGVGREAGEHRAGVREPGRDEAV